jgi:hypothetical protein
MKLVGNQNPGMPTEELPPQTVAKLLIKSN